MKYEIIESLEPSLEHIKSWQTGKENELGSIVEAVKQYRNKIIENPELFVESDEYLYCQRAINLLAWYKHKGAFQEILVIHEIFSLNDYDDFMSGTCSRYLETCVSKDDFSEILTRWKKTEKDSFHYCDLFTLLIKSDPQNQELLAFAKKALWEDNFILKSDIAEHVIDDSVLQEMKRRLRYIGPMVKYLSPNRGENPYLDEMFELGSSYIERKYGLKSPDIEPLTTEDEFIIDILGHTDDRSVKLIQERVDRHKVLEPEYLKLLDQRTDYFEREFMDSLPATSEEWFNGLGCTKGQRDEFFDAALEQGYLGRFHDNLATKVGRNDPCPCGSGLKYKKCCL